MDSTDQIDESMEETLLGDTVENAPEPGPAPKKNAVVPVPTKRGRPAKATPSPKVMIRHPALARVVSPANQQSREMFNTNGDGESSYTEDETSGITEEEGESGTEEEESEEEEDEDGEGGAGEPEAEAVVVAAAGAAAPFPKAKAKPKTMGKKNITKDGKPKRKKKAGPNNYTMYIYKVHRQLHKDMTISTKTMDILNSFTNDMFERIATEAASLAKLHKKRTLGSHEIATATRLVLGYNSLGDHAIAEGMKSLALYQRSVEKV